MRVLGIILLIAGIVMIFFREINFTQTEEVADLGPVEINKTENRNVNWPTYAGLGVAALGIVALIASRNQNTKRT